jgi:uncharacterized membrane protein
MKLRHVIALLPLALACSNDEPTVPDISPRYARPTGGSGTTIPAVQLGNLKQINCSETQAYSINDATPSTVGGYCFRNGAYRPYLWSTTGTRVLADTGMVHAVALDGSAYGELDFKPFKWLPDGSTTLLPLASGRSWGSVYAVGANGQSAFGESQWMDGNNTLSESSAWSFDGASWSVNTPGFYANDVTPSGQHAAGASGAHAARWTLSAGTWSADALPDEGALSSVALGINQDGSVLSGKIERPNTADPSVTHFEPVVWISNVSGGWNIKHLGGLNIVEGSAVSVSTQTNGTVIAVGEAWEDLPGPNAQLWAVAWKLPLGASQFNAPIRLSPAAGGVPAWANDINSRGEVVGGSYTKTTQVAVMWKL